MSRRMPMPPMTLPSGSRSAEALRVVGITSPLALVAQDADHADRPTVGIAEGGGIQARGDHLAARTARVQPHVPHDASLDDFAQRRRELPRFRGADEARQRLLEHLILAKPEQL